MNTMAQMSAIELPDGARRLASVSRVHNVLNARRLVTPMPVEQQQKWFMAGSFAILCLMGVAAVL